MKLDKYEVKDMKLDKKLFILGFLVMAIGTVAAQTTVVSLINALICRLITILWGVSAAVATIVMVIAGIRWIGSSEDAGARAQAKSTIVHAIIGLIIVIVALSIVNYAITGAGVLSTLTFSCRP
ncbi:MAG: hypothetical protein DRO89_05760 [Candidatus Altiarchaeales archaeon]|nr:MAG: hypothetical protein DRO89_05760 [Candidatus Altiarchaeales archaeon]